MTALVSSDDYVFSNSLSPFDPLSTFNPDFRIRLHRDLVAGSVEAVYQAAKFPHAPEVQKKIFAAGSRRALKAVLAAHREQVRADWSEVREPILAWCLRLKLAQHFREVGKVFGAIGHRAIHHWSSREDGLGDLPHDGMRWEACGVLGRLLTALKDEWLADRAPSLLESPLRVVPPPDVAHVVFLGEPVTTWRPGAPVAA